MLHLDERVILQVGEVARLATNDYDDMSAATLMTGAQHTPDMMF